MRRERRRKGGRKDIKSLENRKEDKEELTNEVRKKGKMEDEGRHDSIGK